MMPAVLPVTVSVPSVVQAARALLGTIKINTLDHGALENYTWGEVGTGENIVQGWVLYAEKD